MAGKTSNEGSLLRGGIEALRRTRFFQDIQVLPPDQEGAGSKLKLKGKWGTATYHVTLQPKLVESAVPALAHRYRSESNERPLVVTSYVPPALAEQLEQRQVEFLDAAGNAYLDHPIYIFISGRKGPRQSIRPNRALRPAGLRLLYVLLRNPAIFEKTQRELASAAGIALGSVPVILDGLRRLGYLRRTDAGRQTLANTHDLLFRWEQGYGELLRPKLFVQTCRMAGANVAIDDLLPRLRQHPTVLLGGELGAAVLTKQLRPETATLHISDDERTVMSSLRLMPDSEGNITLLRTFGTQSAADEPRENAPLADPLLIHAELVQISGDRIQEIAKSLLEQYIQPRLA